MKKQVSTIKRIYHGSLLEHCTLNCMFLLDPTLLSTAPFTSEFNVLQALNSARYIFFYFSSLTFLDNNTISIRAIESCRRKLLRNCKPMFFHEFDINLNLLTSRHESE